MMGTTGLSITLANSIIGVGILAMPFCFQQCGVLLASLILLSMGLVSRLCCYFLLKSSILARRRNFEFLAFHVFGPAGKLAVEVGIIGFLMGTCIAYFVVVGDLGPQIIAKMFNINQSDVLRTSIMVIVSLVCVLPLGLLRNVDSLSNVSAATIGFYFCLVMKVIAEAATKLPSGEFYNMELWKPSGVLQCVPIFSMALFCQTQLFEIFESLPSLTLEKMNVVTKNAINICTSVYFTLGLFGFIAFSSREISGNILMSLSPTMASDVIKLGFVMSVAFSFPLIIFPCRASLYSLLYKKVHSSQHDHIINHSIPETSFRCITVGIIAVTLFISLLIPNIELVLGLVGSTIGVLICVVFPAACFVNLTFKNTNERVLAKGILVLGLIIMVLGTYANLQAAESKLDKYDDRYITPERIDKIVEDFFQKREKNDGKILKSITKTDPLNGINNKDNNNVMKDSEVQPPNPVPPESNSLEIKSPETKVDTLIKDGNLDVLLPEKLKEEAADKVSETHPKNLNKFIDAKVNEIDPKVEKPKEEKQPSNEEMKNEKLNLLKQQQLIETMKQHGEEQKELMQEQKEILDSIIKNNKVNGDKVKEEKVVERTKDVDKQQQLIDTIKQHGQEQKELMKEQKEILDEIIKTKKELTQNKDSDIEAKKKAVESIKQIADIAIKSIGGVTEKPPGVEKEAKQSEKLEQLTNEAVQEIAKKAVETIEAIQDIKMNPDNVPNPEQKDVKPIAANKAPENPNLEPVKQVKEIPTFNSNIKREVNNNVNGAIQSNVNKPIDQPIPVEKIVPEIQQNVPKTIVNADINSAAKAHSHSPDEPQSYQVGEDIEIKQIENRIKQNLPLALAMNGLKDATHIKEVKPVVNDANSQKNGVAEDIKLANPVINSASQAKPIINGENQVKPIINGANGQKNSLAEDIKSKIVNEQVPIEKAIPRQKREVVDCTKTMLLEPNDRKICESLVISKVKEIVSKTNEMKIPKAPLKVQTSEEILPNVDFNEKLIRLPLDHHIGRSLKNYNEKKR